MSKWNMYLMSHNSLREDAPLPAPAVVVAITCDPRLIGSVNPEKVLQGLAGRFGLVDFEIVSAEALDLPGRQLGLPFPPVATKRRR